MIEVNYLDHMGTDLSVVNAAKVSFGSRSEWAFVNTKKDGTRNFVLHPKDQSLISFLARGCTSGEWDNLVGEITDKGVAQAYDDFAIHPVTEEECEEYDKELRGLLNHIKKMPAHWSPFAHTAITMNIKMPIFVARQIMKHTTGIEFNEISRRYVDSEPEFFVPDVWRKKADNVKQGSSKEPVDMVSDDVWYDAYEGNVNMEVALNLVADSVRDLYSALLSQGVAPEQARMVLPQSMMTEVVMTGNLYALANLYNQRIDPHAQYESQLVAKGVGDILSDLFPHSFKELTK